MIISFSIIGAPTQRISTRNSTSNARWGTGPQHREFQQEILQTMRVGVRGPNTENFNKKFYRQCALGYGAPTQRISTRNSTDNARRVGVRGPNTENFNKKFYRQCALGYGAPTQRISTRNSTDNARWGTGPQHREFQQEILQAMRVGVRAPT